MNPTYYYAMPNLRNGTLELYKCRIAAFNPEIVEYGLANGRGFKFVATNPEWTAELRKATSDRYHLDKFCALHSVLNHLREIRPTLKRMGPMVDKILETYKNTPASMAAVR